jgi:periplasmic protein TonB
MGRTLRQEPMFSGLPAAPRAARRRAGFAASVAVHAAILGPLILAPILAHEQLPPHRDYIRALLYAPPPPPPPPPPKGSPFVREPARPAPAATPRTSPPALALPDDMVKVEAPPQPETSQGMEVWGTPEGSEAGVPEGMEGGVVGGTVGGIPGGVLGGVVGGTGDIPVLVKDYDRPPRLLTKTKPVYPPDAFKKKIEGTVLVEILIGPDGRIRRARVLESVPALDAAALRAVTEWTFAPAVKDGRAVATVALAPVSFRIY